MQHGPLMNALLLAFNVKPLSVRSSPCSEYSSSLATLLAVGWRERKIATPSKVPEGKCGKLLFKDLRSRHEPFKLSKMTAVGVFVAIVPVRRTDISLYGLYGEDTVYAKTVVYPPERTGRRRCNCRFGISSYM